MRFVASNLDLSKMPAPDVVRERPVDFETIFDERIEDLSTRLNEAGIPYDTGNLEGDPLAILEQEDAYREMLDLQAINDAARARMLAFATGTDLEHIAAFFGITRAAIVENPRPRATNPEDWEDDASLRRRVQLAPEAYPHGGTAGSYKHLALQAAPDKIKDVDLVKRPGGYVDVILLGRDGDGTVSGDVVNKVARVFKADDGATLTDIVSVRSASILPYAIEVVLRVPLGPDPSIIQKRAQDSLAAVAAELHRIGEPHPTDALIAAARAPNVRKLVLLAPLADVQPAPDQAAFCTSISVSIEVAHD